jgi:YVTN family beta-propeller protein
MTKILPLFLSILLISYLILISNLTIIISNAQSSQVSKIELEETPYWLAFNNSNGYIYTTNQEDRSIYVIDTLEQRVVETIALTEQPSHIIFNPSNNKMYVTAETSIFVIDSANQIEKQIPIQNPFSMAFNPVQNSIYVTQTSLNLVQIIDSSDTPTNTISIDNPYAIEFNPSNNYIYVTEYANNFVSVIDTNNNQVIDRILVGKGPNSIEFNPINNNMYVSHSRSDTVSIIDSKTNEVVTSIVPDSGTIGLDVEFNPREGNIYVSTNNGIYIIDSNSNDIIGKYPDIGNALSMAFNPLDGKIYFTQPYELPSHIGSLSPLHLPTAVCPIEYLQHWEIISFTIKSKEVAEILGVPFNEEKGSTHTLDIIFQRSHDEIPSELIPLEQKVLDHFSDKIELPSELQNIIEIVDLEYSTICAEDFNLRNTIENKFDEIQSINNTNITSIKK